MFYAIPKGREEEWAKVLSTISDIFPGHVYAKDMMIVIHHNQSFCSDQAFMDAFHANAENEQERSLLWRLHTLTWAAKNALKLEGDFVECGVFKGFCSKVIFDYLDFAKSGRQAYLYDTFSGLPAETSSVYEREAWNDYYGSMDSDEIFRGTCERFSAYPNVHVVRGIVPFSFKEKSPRRIAFLHLDMNSSKAEVLALDHLFERVVPGGFVILDDFGWTVSIHQNIAETKFFSIMNHSVLELPTGQGLVIKKPEDSRGLLRRLVGALRSMRTGS